jgi:hypothetical protein
MFMTAERKPGSENEISPDILYMPGGGNAANVHHIVLTASSAAEAMTRFNPGADGRDQDLSHTHITDSFRGSRGSSPRSV